jgi:hypothetical protein
VKENVGAEEQRRSHRSTLVEQQPAGIPQSVRRAEYSTGRSLPLVNQKSLARRLATAIAFVAAHRRRPPSSAVRLVQAFFAGKLVIRSMKTYREIAEELGVTPRTAFNICTRALRKMAASPAAAEMRGLVHDQDIARRKPVSSMHAARAHVFGRRQA